MHFLSLSNLLLLVVVVTLVYGEDQVSPTQLRALGDQALQSRDYSKAVDTYSLLIRVEGTRQINYYKRSVANLLAKNLIPSLRDVERCVELDPDFVQGRLHRSKLYLRLGKCESALSDLDHVLSLDPGHSEASRQREQTLSCISLSKSADTLFAQKDFKTLEGVLEELVGLVPSSLKYVSMQMEVLMSRGDWSRVIGSSGQYLQYDGDQVSMYLLRGQAYEALDEDEHALRQYKQGLRLDPEHAKIKKAWKRLKKVRELMEGAEQDMLEKQWSLAVEKLDKAFALDKTYVRKLKIVHLKRCECLKELKEYARGVQACEQALELLEGGSRESVEAQLLRAELYLGLEEWELAQQDFEAVSQKGSEDRGVHERVSRGRIAVKKALRKDHYKILGVSVHAEAREIKQAFKRLAIQYHPDKQVGKSEEELMAAEKMFRDVAEAKEVLLDPERRASFDRGDDLHDDGRGRGGGFHGHHGGFPHGFPGGGGQRFTFHSGGGFRFH